MKISVLFLIIIGMHTEAIFAQNKWIGGTGIWNDPQNWSYGTVPTLVDDVLITEGTVNLEEGSAYFAHNVEIYGDAKIFFLGNTMASDIHIYGNLVITQDVVLTYEPNSISRWIFAGSNTIHEILTEGNNLHTILLDDSSSQIELLGNLFASSSVRIKSGTLQTNDHDIETATFSAGGGCSSLNCPPKTLNLGTSIITCTALWSGQFNYGSLVLNGNYTIEAPIFEAGANVTYNNVVLKDYESNNFSLFSYNMWSTECVYNNLTIDNIYDTKIAGEITVNGTFKVNHQGKKIIASKTGNGDNKRWSFNGTVDLPAYQGGCYDFTTIVRGLVSDTFSFHTINSDLEFDWAIIQGIPTSGGGSFTVNNGYVAGYNSGWNNGQNLPSKNLYWIGGTGDWNDGSHWSLSSGGSPHGCSPSVRDNVIFDENSFSSSTETVRLIYDETNYCRNFIWKMMNENAQIIDISLGLSVHPDLYIAGNVDIEMPDIFDFDGANILFIGNDEHGLNSASPLPQSQFISSAAGYLQENDLVFDKGISFTAGYYSTEGYNLQVNGNLFCRENQPKEFFLNGSTINVTNICSFGNLFNGNVQVHAGTSHIICNQFSSLSNSFDIIETNSPIAYNINPNGPNLYIRKFVMNGGPVDFLQSGLNTDSLVLNSSNAKLRLSTGSTSNVYKDIVSTVTLGNVPKIEEVFSLISIDPKIIFHKNNTCIYGLIEFENIEAINPTPVNVPEGIDGGGNTNFDFTPTPAYAGTLYWVGRSGEMKEPQNWSVRSGGCPEGIDPSTADQLIIDDKGVMGQVDTIKVSSSTFLEKIRWQNVGQINNDYVSLYCTSTLYTKEWEIINSDVRMSSPSNRTLFVDHHFHITNSYLLAINMTFLLGGISSTLNDVTLKMGDNSAFIAEDLNIFLRGQAADLTIPTLKFESGSIFINQGGSELYTFSPTTGQPTRDIRIEANNAHFDLFRPFLSQTTPLKVTISEDIRCDSLQLNNPMGTLEISAGANLKIEN